MKADPILKWVVLVLVLTGFFILTSASIGLTVKRELPPYYFILRQLLTGGLAGFLALVITSRINYRRWRSWALLIFLGALVLTFLVFLPEVGFEFGGARRWVQIGPLNFQPSEFLKFGYILYLAAFFSSHRADIRSFGWGFLPFLLLSAVASIPLIFEPDIGTLGVMILSGLFLFLAAGGSWKHFLVFGLLGAVLLSALIYLAPYRLERLLVFLNPNYAPQGSGYQVRQSLIAIGSGGLWGRGFGMSRQKFQYLPEPTGDSIFSVAAEEFGFVGSAFLVGLFLIFAWRGFYISARAPDFFAKLLGSGIVILIVTQVFINIAALSGFLPLTGIPLLFVSQGGSALAVTLAEAGILLGISKTKR